MTNLNKPKCIIRPRLLYRLALATYQSVVKYGKLLVELRYWPRWVIVHKGEDRSE